MDFNRFNYEGENENVDQNHPFAAAMRLNAMARGVSWLDSYHLTNQNLNK